MTYFALLSLVTATLLGMTASDDDTWKAFHARMKNFDTTLDYTQVRMAYAASSAYQPYGSSASELLSRVPAALKEEDFARARVLIDSIFIEQPLNNEAYAAKAWILEKMGEPDSARLYRRIMDSLMESLISSGNGRSAATAMVVINTSEEYAFMEAFELTSVHQSLQQVNGRRYDLVTCRTTDGDTVRLWFNVDLPMEHLSRMMRQKK